ncbi:MAG: ZinT/AdcA family metal-binding protein, partial [Treponema sp.]|nr:ZinT/AdcA family metal-binding protein [Treponema sp.]
MKKIFALAGILLALGMGSAFAKKASDENKVKVVTTIFPEYDWVKEIVGEKADDVELTLLLNNGVDLHSYQPSVKDIAKIQEADIFVYVGGESDEWVDDVLKNVKSPNQKVINLLEVLGDRVKTEEIVEGMEHEHHHGHDHDDDEHGHDDHDGDHHDEHDHDHDEHEHEHHDSHAHSHASEIHADDIKDRSLSEFNGEWQSLYPILVSGKLEEYVEHQAEEKGKSEKEMQKEIEAKWNCGAKLVKIDGNKITLTYDNGKSVSGTYKYAGYAVKKNDEGKITNVRYKFETKDKNAPKYVMFNDHGFEPAKEVAHFHFYFGDNNFEEFMNSKVNSYFVDSKLSAHECEDLLLGRNHDDHDGDHNDEHGHDHDEHEHEHDAHDGHHNDHDEHGHDAHEHGHDHEDEEKDEHVWLSLKNAQILTSAIYDALCQADS